MSEFMPVTTFQDMRTLDAEEVEAGYASGLLNTPEPTNNHTRSFWHGWRNGVTDGGFRNRDSAQLVLSQYLRVVPYLN